MKLAGLMALAALGAVTAQASDFVGIYGVISKVVFEPNADHPQRVQVFGVFSIADNLDRSKYREPQRGYLYFTLEGIPQNRQDAAVHEWMDLKIVAGTNMAIAFTGRLTDAANPPPRVRNSDEKPSAPEPYRLGTGAGKVRADTDYAPISALFKPIQ